MAVTQVPYFLGLPTISLTFTARKSSRLVVRQLLVDSGFTGQSALVLSAGDCQMFRSRFARASEVGGALRGVHQRVWVKCALPELGFSETLLALSADLAPFSLAKGIDGLVGLSFLTRFVRWGGEQNATGDWTFFLQT